MKTKQPEKKIIGYKGFNSKLQCTPDDKVYQFEVGKEYEEEAADLCKSGFHFCENPLDVFGYYCPADSRYCEIEANGVSEQTESDTKRCAKKIKIAAEISLSGLINAGVKFILEKIDWNNNKESNTGDRSAATNTGDRSAPTNTGDQSAATNTGYRSAATNTGNRSAATVEGNSSVAISTGYKGKAKATKGSAIVLVERDDNGNLLSIKSAIIDGEILKENTFYTLEKGEFKEVE